MLKSISVYKLNQMGYDLRSFRLRLTSRRLAQKLNERRQRYTHVYRVMAQRKRYIDVKRSFRFASETNTAFAKGKWGKQRESQTTGHPNQRRKISWHASHGMQRSIDRSERVFVEISCSCNFCGSYYG